MTSNPSSAFTTYNNYELYQQSASQSSKYTHNNNNNKENYHPKIHHHYQPNPHSTSHKTGSSLNYTHGFDSNSVFGDLTSLQKSQMSKAV